jgi:hypothetical protein
MHPRQSPAQSPQFNRVWEQVKLLGWRKVASDSRGFQINLGYRNSLLLQQCEKWGSYHFDEHNGWQHVKDPTPV